MGERHLAFLDERDRRAGHTHLLPLLIKRGGERVYFCGITVSPGPPGCVDPEQAGAIPPAKKRANVDSVPSSRSLMKVIMGANGNLGG